MALDIRIAGRYRLGRKIGGGVSGVCSFVQAHREGAQQPALALCLAQELPPCALLAEFRRYLPRQVEAPWWCSGVGQRKSFGERLTRAQLAGSCCSLQNDGLHAVVASCGL